MCVFVCVYTRRYGLRISRQTTHNYTFACNVTAAHRSFTICEYCAFKYANKTPTHSTPPPHTPFPPSPAADASATLRAHRGKAAVSSCESVLSAAATTAATAASVAVLCFCVCRLWASGRNWGTCVRAWAPQSVVCTSTFSVSVCCIAYSTLLHVACYIPASTRYFLTSCVRRASSISSRVSRET